MDRKRSSNWYKKIVATESIILVGILISIGLAMRSSNRENSTNEAVTQDEADDMLKQQEILKSTLQEKQELIIASGSIDMSFLFSNKDNDVMQDKNDNYMKAIWKKLFKQEIKYNTSYTYNYTYEVSDIDIESNDKIQIIVYADCIKLKDLTENLDKVKFDETYGWLAEDFTPKEIKAIQKRSKDKTYNYLITNTQDKEKAIESLQGLIKGTCRKLDISNYEIKVIGNNTITNQDQYTQVISED